MELCSNKEEYTVEGNRLIACGYTAHPSRLKLPTDIEAVAQSLSIAAAGIDQQIPKAKAKQIEDILKAKTAKTKDQGVEHEFVMYEDVHHGFAVRADENEGYERECGKKAEDQAVRWFTKWFEHAA